MPPLESRMLALRALARVWAAPTAAWVSEVRRAVDEGVLEVPRELVNGAGFGEAVEADYHRWFGSGGTCPLGLAFYLSENPYEQAQRLAEIQGAYLAFGVETREGQRPDDLPVLLEFLAYLDQKRAYARARGWAEREAVSADAAKKLCGEIVRPAVGVLAARLEDGGAHGLYRRAAGEIVKITEVIRHEA